MGGTELHSLEEALSRKNRQERTDGESRVVKDRSQLGHAGSSGAPQPRPRLGTTAGR